MKMNVLKITMPPRSLRLTSTANPPKASRVCTGTTTRAKAKLFSSAWPKAADRSGSVNRREYCSKPTNRAGRGAVELNPVEGQDNREDEWRHQEDGKADEGGAGKEGGPANLWPESPVFDRRLDGGAEGACWRVGFGWSWWRSSTSCSRRCLRSFGRWPGRRHSGLPWRPCCVDGRLGFTHLIRDNGGVACGDRPGDADAGLINLVLGAAGLAQLVAQELQLLAGGAIQC